MSQKTFNLIRNCKRYGVFNVKGFNVLVISELKQIKISSLQSWIVVFEIEKSFVKPYLYTHHIPNHSKWRKYEVRTKESLRTIFVKTFEVNYHLSLSCVFFSLLLYFWCSKSICKLLICLSNNKKLLNLVKEWEKYFKNYVRWQVYVQWWVILSYKCKIPTNLSTNVTITPNVKFMLRKTTYFCIHIKNVN